MADDATCQASSNPGVSFISPETYLGYNEQQDIGVPQLKPTDTQNDQGDEADRKLAAVKKEGKQKKV